MTKELNYVCLVTELNLSTSVEGPVGRRLSRDGEGRPDSEDGGLLLRRKNP